MSITPIPTALYPLVPNAPGVPALLRAGAQIFDSITLGFIGAGAALDSLIGAEVITWGVFDPAGVAIADYDSFYSTEYTNDSTVSDYPIEGGSFATYNKVDSPFDVNVTLICGGDNDRRGQFLTALETARKSLTLYTVVTPNFTYTNVNFPGINYRRETKDGANIIIANMRGREIRTTAMAAFSMPQDPLSADTVNLGQVKTVDDSSFDDSGVV